MILKYWYNSIISSLNIYDNDTKRQWDNDTIKMRQWQWLWVMILINWQDNDKWQKGNENEKNV